MPDHEHQTGRELELENSVVESQSWSVFRGSLRDDFIDRRVEAAAASVAAARTSDALIRSKKIENGIRGKSGERFMILRFSSGNH